MDADQPHQPRAADLSRHWDWRPEWKDDRPCLYWYLAFDQDILARAVAPRLLATIAATPWLDPIPLRWMHLTLCDLGFVDEVSDDDVELAVSGLQMLRPAIHLPALTLGPPTGMESAVVLAAQPLYELHRLREQLRAITGTAIGHRNDPGLEEEFRPHVSLGYVKRSVASDEVEALTGTYSRVPATYSHVPAELPVKNLILAAVTRKRTHYEWTVRATFSTAR